MSSNDAMNLRESIKNNPSISKKILKHPFITMRKQYKQL